MALIVAPTRELALQIYEEAQLIGRYTGFEGMVQIVGGVDYVKQADLLQRRGGHRHLHAGPHHRLLQAEDLQDRQYPHRGHRRGRPPAGPRVCQGHALHPRNLPSYDQRQSMLFSATLSYRVMELTYEYMNLPEFMDGHARRDRRGGDRAGALPRGQGGKNSPCCWAC
jgi:ATP-dependent RNA helicase RhlB